MIFSTLLLLGISPVGFYMDWRYLLFMLPAMALAGLAQLWLSSAYARGQRVPTQMTGFMAARHILVEIGLSSSDVILGIKGSKHPLRTYLRYGVPIALATDDEGVARSNLTLVFRKAVQEPGVDYRTLKRMVRNSITYSFAEDTVKSRLSRELDEAFTRFESRRLH